MKTSKGNTGLSATWFLLIIWQCLAQSLIAQPFLPGAIVASGVIDLNDNTLTTDSFDSSNPQFSINGQYARAKAKENGDIFAGNGVTNSIGVGAAKVFGHLHTSISTGVPSIGSVGAIGSRSWQSNHTGIEPGWWLQDADIVVPDIAFPDTGGYLVPTNGVFPSTDVYVNSYPSNSVALPVPVPPDLATNFTSLTTVTYPQDGSYVPPVLTNYLGDGTIKNYTFNFITGYSWAVSVTNVYYSTNSYDQVFWGNAASTNNYVANSISGRSIVFGPNVVLALPNGLSMKGSDMITITLGASLTIYCSGTSCTAGANGVINASGNAARFALLCASSVTSLAINGNGALAGLVIAPNAKVNLNGGGSSPVDFVGSLVANSVVLNGNFNCHYDEHLFGMFSPPATCVAPPAGLVTWWPGDGNADDISGHSSALVFGGTSFVTGKVGQAFSFNGTDAYIRTNSVATTAVDNWSMAAWVNWSGLIGTPSKEKQTLIYNGNEGSSGYGIIIPQQGLCSLEPSLCGHVGELVILFGGVSYIPTGVALDQNTWEYVALVRENGILKLYKNGTLVFSSSTGSPNAPSPGNGYTTVGTAPGYAFYGLVDEIMLCDTALTADQISMVSSASGLGVCKPLVLSIAPASSGGIILTLSGQTAKTIQVYASSDLLNWVPVAALPNPQGTFTWTDSTSSGTAPRFYKAVAAN